METLPGGGFPPVTREHTARHVGGARLRPHGGMHQPDAGGVEVRRAVCAYQV
jgi:hypothetical protein